MVISNLCCKCHNNPRASSGGYCLECQRVYSLEAYHKNKEKIKGQRKEYEHSERRHELHRKHKKDADIKYPWKKTMRGMRARCNPDSTYKTYASYRKKGIQVKVDIATLERLWFYYGADKMRHPQIHRLDNDGHYEEENIVYLEKGEHHIITYMNRFKKVSKGFIRILERFILRNEERAEEIGEK